MMTPTNTFGLIGGDERMRYLAFELAEDGFPVYVHGQKNCGKRNVIETDLEDVARKSTVVILPLPVTRDGRTLNAPFAEKPIYLDDDFARLFLNHTVYGGMIPQLLMSSSLWQEIMAEDYYCREELAVGNAIPTAEGAIGIAVDEYPGTINGAKCLITGFGRIGKTLALDLRGLGARVYCAARKKEDLMMMRAFGVEPLTYREIGQRFDLIFNTVPASVLSATTLAKQTADTMIIELASAPGGVDLLSAEKRGIRVINAQSLPGRVAPKTAAAYIKEAVYNMLEE